MLERTHIGIESHKTQLWFDLEDNDTKSVSKAAWEIMQFDLKSLTTKRRKQGQVSDSIQDLKLTSTWIINQRNWKHPSEARGSEIKLSCESLDKRNYIFFPQTQINWPTTRCLTRTALSCKPLDSSGEFRGEKSLIKKAVLNQSLRGKWCGVNQKDFVSEFKTDYVKSFYIL